MIDAGRYINRVTLLYFEDLRGVPRAYEDILGYLKTRIDPFVEHKVSPAIKYLESAGYIQPCQATVADEPLWKITAKGSQQAKKMVAPADLDHMIWE